MNQLLGECLDIVTCIFQRSFNFRVWHFTLKCIDYTCLVDLSMNTGHMPKAGCSQSTNVQVVIIKKLEAYILNPLPVAIV